MRVAARSRLVRAQSARSITAGAEDEQVVDEEVRIDQNCGENQSGETKSQGMGRFPNGGGEGDHHDRSQEIQRVGEFGPRNE